MESFIRSKYETRRWAMDGPLPSDPSVLDGPAQSTSNGDTATLAVNAPLLDTTLASTPSPVRSTHAPTASLSAPRPASPSIHSPTTFRHNTAHSHAQSRQLLSAAVAGRVPVHSAPSQPQPQSQPQQLQQQQQPQPEDDFFTLDFHAPPASKSTPQPPTKDVKQDILSLFSAAPAPAPAAQSAIQSSNAFGQFASAAPSSSWDAFGGGSIAQTHGQQQQSISMMGTTGTSLWGASGWTGGNPPSSANIWGNSGTGTTSTLGVVNTTDIWGGSTHAAQPAQASKKDDVFGDLWGDFK